MVLCLSLILIFRGRVPAESLREEPAEPDMNPYTCLEAQGLSAETWEVVLAWQERASGSPGLVQGVRARHRYTGVIQDFYCSPEGMPLTVSEAQALGVHPKRWEVRTVALDGASASPRAKSSRPALKEQRPPSLVADAAAPLWLVAPPDSAAIERLRWEDTYTLSKGVMRTGIRIPLDIPLPLVAAKGAALRTARPTETALSLRLTSPGATSLRVRLEGASWPIGAQLWVYNVTDPDEYIGPIFLPCGAGVHQFWTPTVFSDTVGIDIVIPNPIGSSGHADSAGEKIGSWSVTEMVYGYEDLSKGWLEKAGACNLDVSCYGDWLTEASSVGGLGSVDRAGSLFCTGSLLNDFVPQTAIPYLLAANHCLSLQTQADTLEVYWFYQTSACNGSVPRLSEVPRSTGGADILATSSQDNGSDFTLLRLRGSVPETAYFLGFETNAQIPGTQTVCIHHPRGEYKRISFGRLTTDARGEQGPLKPLSRFYENLWSQGTTEPGSSGSPLIRADTGRVIGQLYGGNASCSVPNEPDYFGRFDVTYPLVEMYLGASPLDVDGSGTIDVSDLRKVQDIALGRENSSAADVNTDGNVDALDLQILVNAVSS